MGRETKLLLGFLGLLAGVFVGVLSMKLLVPRPPTGAGPDIRPEVAMVTPQERVDPPAPAAAGWNFAAAPPLVAEEPRTEDRSAEPPRSSRFTTPARPEPRASGAVTPASWQGADEEALPPLTVAGDSAPPGLPPPADRGAPGRADPETPSLDPPPLPPAAPRAAPPSGVYLVRPGDSWWDLADRAYGDGRLYRALFAWNRARDPRISLAPGTRLDVPQLARLQAAWPRLVPGDPR